MQKEPERAFLCGPFGIDRILARVRQGYVRDPKIDAAQSTRRGTSMAQMLELAASVGLKMQVARRTPARGAGAGDPRAGGARLERDRVTAAATGHESPHARARKRGHLH